MRTTLVTLLTVATLTSAADVADVVSSLPECVLPCFRENNKQVCGDSEEWTCACDVKNVVQDAWNTGGACQEMFADTDCIAKDVGDGVGQLGQACVALAINSALSTDVYDISASATGSGRSMPTSGSTATDDSIAESLTSLLPVLSSTRNPTRSTPTPTASMSGMAKLSAAAGGSETSSTAGGAGQSQPTESASQASPSEGSSQAGVGVRSFSWSASVCLGTLGVLVAAILR